MFRGMMDKLVELLDRIRICPSLDGRKRIQSQMDRIRITVGNIVPLSAVTGICFKLGG